MNMQQLAANLMARAKVEREKSLYHYSQGPTGSALHLHLEGMAMGLELAAGIVAANAPASADGDEARTPQIAR